MRDRIKKLLKELNIEIDRNFAEKTGISIFRWNNYLTGKQRLNEDHIKAIYENWPEYLWWVITGESIPEIGFWEPGKENEEPQKGKLIDATDEEIEDQVKAFESIKKAIDKNIETMRRMKKGIYYDND